MLIELTSGSHTTRADLRDGTLRVGGGPGDDIRLAGLSEALLTLRIDAERLTVTAATPLAIGKATFAAHLPRLVVAGERVQLGRGITLRQVPLERRTQGTATLMRALLRGELAIEDTRAATLTCLTGGDLGRVIPLAFETTLLGRGDDCTVQVRDRAVSRRHARLIARDGQRWLEDLRGANGTHVNGQPVLRKVLLRTGDVIELGQTLLRYDANASEGPRTLPSPPSVFVDEKIAEPPRAAHHRSSRWVLVGLCCGAFAALAATAGLLAALV